VARLDTGAKQPGAQRMYEAAGYVAVPDYNGNPYASFWGEKSLGASGAPDPPGSPDPPAAPGPSDPPGSPGASGAP
jgi:hypothetical protein